MKQAQVAQAVALTYHAAYGASGWAGWGHCADWLGGGAASIHAAKGSVTHEVSAECLTSTANPLDYVGRSYTSDGFEIVFDQDLADIATSYVNTVRDLHKTLGGELLVEQGFDLEYITGEPGARSTLDMAIVPRIRGELVIADLKTGAGVPVYAENNGQGVIYALLAYDQYSMVTDITSVRIMIIQPPLNSISEWVITVDELEEWRGRIKAAATAALAPVKVATPSDKSCRWCSKKADCSALNTVVFEAVESVDPADTPSDELGAAMAKVEMIEGWIKAVRAETEKRLLDGRTVSGFKLVQGKRGNRQWSDKAEAEAMLKSMRVKHDQMYSYSVISPTSAEKLVKADAIGDRQWVKLQSLITQSEGAPSVAPESDKRPALRMDAIEFGEASA